MADGCHGMDKLQAKTKESSGELHLEQPSSRQPFDDTLLASCSDLDIDVSNDRSLGIGSGEAGLPNSSAVTNADVPTTVTTLSTITTTANTTSTTATANTTSTTATANTTSTTATANTTNTTDTANITSTTDTANSSQGAVSNTQPANKASQTYSQISLPNLPDGWEARKRSDGKILYIDHNTRSTQWANPREGGLAVVRYPERDAYKQIEAIVNESLLPQEYVTKWIDA